MLPDDEQPQVPRDEDSLGDVDFDAKDILDVDKGSEASSASAIEGVEMPDFLKDADRPAPAKPAPASDAASDKTPAGQAPPHRTGEQETDILDDLDAIDVVDLGGSADDEFDELFGDNEVEPSEPTVSHAREATAISERDSRDSASAADKAKQTHRPDQVEKAKSDEGGKSKQ